MTRVGGQRGRIHTHDAHGPKFLIAVDRSAWVDHVRNRRDRAVETREAIDVADLTLPELQLGVSHTFCIDHGSALLHNDRTRCWG